MRTAVLEASAVTRDFRLPRTSLLGRRPIVHAVRGVDLQVFEGETLGLVGESGSGKSTLARILMGLDQPTSGGVTYRGRSLSGASHSELRELRRSMQIIFQDPDGSLDPRMRVRTIISEPLRSLGIEGDHRARVREVLSAVGLPDAAIDRFPHEFSGGQRQRIAIARALAPDPRLLIADEPVSALDVSVRAKTLNLLQDLKERFELTMVIISHDLSVMHHVCDRVAVMYAGEIVELGPVEGLFDDPRHPYSRTLLDAIPRLRGGLLGSAEVDQTPPSATDAVEGCSFASRCRLVHDKCLAEAPSLVAVESTPGWAASCHLVETGWEQRSGRATVALRPGQGADAGEERGQHENEIHGGRRRGLGSGGRGLRRR